MWYFFFFFFNDTATTEIYTLSLHDALPICQLGVGFGEAVHRGGALARRGGAEVAQHGLAQDRKSTRLNSSHLVNSYAVFCLKKKKNRHATLPAVTTSCPTQTCTTGV